MISTDIGMHAVTKYTSKSSKYTKFKRTMVSRFVLIHLM